MALAVSSAAVAFQHSRVTDPHVVYDRYSLPGFDAFVYVAMAENPAVFTVAPWGSRILPPAVVQALWGRSVVRGYRLLTLGALIAAGGLLFVSLRRLGHPAWLVLLAVGVFGLSAPVAEALRSPFLGEPLTAALMVGFLAAVESGAGLGVLSLLLLLGTLSKELSLLLVPFAALAAYQRQGGRAALATTVVMPLPAVAALVFLRRWASAPAAGGATAVLVDSAAAALVLDSWESWWRPMALGGLLPLALVGSLRARARSFLLRAGYLAAAFLVLPLAAAVYPGEGRIVNFFAADVPRLLIYALPFVLALALFAVPAQEGEPPRLVATRSRGDRLAFALACAGAALLPWGLDGYRRLDLRGVRDGPLVLTLCRESLRTARRLERGEPVVFDVSGPGYVWGESDPGAMSLMRWYLREGWGDKPHYGQGPLALTGKGGSFVVPSLGSSPLEVRVALAGDLPDQLLMASPGGNWQATAKAQDGAFAFLVPRGVLRRGDNVFWLSAPGSAPTVRFLTLAPLPGG